MRLASHHEATMRAIFKSGLLLLPPVRRIYLQRNLALAERNLAVAERDRAITELHHQRRNNGVSYCRGAEDQSRAIQLFRLFSPVTAVSAPMVRVGHMGDGGYVMADCFTRMRAAFSFGIGGDVSWDRDIARRSITVYQYDDSIEAPPVVHHGCVFHKKSIGAERKATCESITSVLQTYGAPGDANILKMDIEGSEWDVFDAATTNDLKRFSQIVCEFHDFERIANPRWYQRALRCMTKLRSLFEVVHVHGNNHAHVGLFANVAFPVVLEVTFLTKSGHTFVANKQIFPTSLDAANEPGFADIFLGSFQF